MELELRKNSEQRISKEFDNDYEAYLCENIRRDEELIKFIDEFVNSREFHLVQMQNKYKKVFDYNSDCVCTECWENTKKPDLIKRAQEIWAAERRFEKYVKDKYSKGIIKKQERSIAIIREKIAEAKERHLCHIDEREQIKEKHREKVLDDLKNLYGIPTTHLTTKGRVVDKVLAYYKVRYTQRKRKKKRMISIIQKIINEYKRQKKIDELKNKRYDTKVVRKEKILTTMTIIGTKIELLPQYEPTTEIKQEQLMEISELEQPEPEQKDKEVVPADKNEKNKEISKSEEKPQKDKADKPGKKDNADKGNKKGKIAELQEEKELVLPYIPQNKRYKIKPIKIQKIEELIQKFDIMKVVEQEGKKFQEKRESSKGVFYAEDSLFYCHPKSLIFHGYKNGVVYRKRLKVYNGGHVEKKCRFHLVRLDELNPLLVEVEPIGIQSIIPGMYFNITVTFTPEMLDKRVNGNIIFLTYQSSKNEYLQVSIPISCIPWCSDVNITPETITFEPLPIWKAKQICDYKNYKTIKFINTGRKPCRIIINKMRDPLRLDDTPSQLSELMSDLDLNEIKTSNTDEILFIKEKNVRESANDLENNKYELYVPTHESEIFAKKVMDECIECVFNAFVFSSYCFHVEGNSEKRVKVYFRNIDHVGYYNEKYLISIFEKFDDNMLSCVGSQKVQLTVVARPQLPEDIIIETATELKREQLSQQKILEWESKQKNGSVTKTIKLDAAKGKNGKDGKNGKNGKKDAKRTSKQEMAEFVVEDKEIVLDYLDMYPAEMVAWKNMDPYYIEAKFCCTLTYSSVEIARDPEKLFFTALCRVVRPSFVSNLNTQHIDFGSVTVGMTARKVLSIQNIQYEPIKPTVTILSPTGFFTCPSPRNIVLPPQHLLQLPLKFTPLEEKQVIEYFEIKAGSTICPLIVSGEGHSCNITINPDFLVCRLEASTGDFADCTIEINNQGKGSVTIEFVKICELIGEIKPGPDEKNGKNASKESKIKLNPKEGKKDNGSSKKGKFTNELTIKEEESLKNNFIHKEGESYFEILGATNNTVDVPPLSKRLVKIHFGVPLPPQNDQIKKGKKGAEKKAKPEKQAGPQKYYVAKYNFMLGKTTFLKDAIILATFI
ncbi:hypothetical protein ILUMI_13155 [Ignelater luminosus]|uniref:Abnormal spindle-like microcephaly-associated protein ASH domain-containing protein n=1 Tax=Ignelater luminosus TaxID=2038154 RepID=A0A8K0CSV8_IGNLU|nr:hypothetical protein ILUMI_13155 [Ignelater luminosus]